MDCSQPAASMSSTLTTATPSSSSIPDTFAKEPNNRALRRQPLSARTLDSAHIIKVKAQRPGLRRVSPFLLLENTLRSTPNSNPLKILRKKRGKGVTSRKSSETTREASPPLDRAAHPPPRRRFFEEAPAAPAVGCRTPPVDFRCKASAHTARRSETQCDPAHYASAEAACSRCVHPSQ